MAALRVVARAVLRFVVSPWGAGLGVLITWYQERSLWVPVVAVAAWLVCAPLARFTEQSGTNGRRRATRRIVNRRD